MEEVQRRAADQFPGWIAPRIAALQDLRKHWADLYRRNEADAQRDDYLLNSAMGLPTNNTAQSATGADDMRDDFSIHIHGDRQQENTQAKTIGNNRTPIALAMLAGWGVLAPIAAGLYWWNQQPAEPQQPPAYQDTDTNTTYYFGDPKPIARLP